MNSRFKNLKVAIVGDHFMRYKGAERVVHSISKVFDNNVDYFFLFGDRELINEKLKPKSVTFSFIQYFPFLKSYYRYTYPLWPIAVELFDLSKYDLVISSSFCVAHGCITGINTKHISYIHTPMRYAYDLTFEYFKKNNLKRFFISSFLNFLRIWDTSACTRSDCLISNSNFIAKRISKYWKREVDTVIYPPVEIYKGSIKKKREEYFVTGMPFETNKNGEFLLKCVEKLKFNLYVIGDDSNNRRLGKRYRRCKYIKMLGNCSDKEKYEILSNAKGYIGMGIEDFGIFPIEAMSCGTPVLVYARGGYMDTLKEGINGNSFKDLNINSFKDVYTKYISKECDYEKISESVKSFSEDRFIKEFEKCIEKLYAKRP